MHPKIGIPKHMSVPGASLKSSNSNITPYGNKTYDYDNGKIYNLLYEGRKINSLKCTPSMKIIILRIDIEADIWVLLLGGHWDWGY